MKIIEEKIFLPDIRSFTSPTHFFWRVRFALTYYSVVTTDVQTLLVEKPIVFVVVISMSSTVAHDLTAKSSPLSQRHVTYAIVFFVRVAKILPKIRNFTVF